MYIKRFNYTYLISIKCCCSTVILFLKTHSSLDFTVTFEKLASFSISTHLQDESQIRRVDIMKAATVKYLHFF